MSVPARGLGAGPTPARVVLVPVAWSDTSLPPPLLPVDEPPPEPPLDEPPSEEPPLADAEGDARGVDGADGRGLGAVVADADGEGAVDVALAEGAGVAGLDASAPLGDGLGVAALGVAALGVAVALGFALAVAEGVARGEGVALATSVGGPTGPCTPGACGPSAGGTEEEVSPATVTESSPPLSALPASNPSTSSTGSASRAIRISRRRRAGGEEGGVEAGGRRGAELTRHHGTSASRSTRFSACRASGFASACYRSSRMVALACPPPSHIVCKP